MAITKDLSLVAVEIRKWDLETNKIGITSFFVMDNQEKSLEFIVNIMQPPEMVEEFLGKLRYEAELKLKSENGTDEFSINFENETFLRQKVYNYFKRITSELNSTKRKKGQPRMIFTTHMDIYNETQDITFLQQRLQFYVVLNWSRKYYEREEFKKAVEPLRKLIKINPGYGPGYQMLARSLKKIRKYDEAMRYYERYAEVENTTEAWLDLAKSYRKGKVFDKSEAIYNRILADDPKNPEARIGIAQIRYATQDQEYIKLLDEIFKDSPDWTRSWLKEEFNFRIYTNDKMGLSPNQAAKFMGYDKIFDLTQRAFRNEIPSHFNPSRARLSFFKEELENWAQMMNRFNCLPGEVKLYPDRIHAEDAEMDEAEAAPAQNASTNNDSGSKNSTKVEEILTQLRARKAQRLAEASGNPQPRKNQPVNLTHQKPAKPQTVEVEETPAKRKRGRPRKTD
ncbi:MAG: tetratricopeptide repeat protein [Calditrichaeota bacterium]|nr:tetratricopeptide repeat protein [Calditrichota bacterium]MCB0270726.1 tetratricopeptide repeat protein [Calditrichota bacterium]